MFGAARLGIAASVSGLGTVTTAASVSVQNSGTNAWVDVSTNALTITKVNSPTTDYSDLSYATSAVGSMDPNDTGSLTIADSALHTYGTGDFTIRGWIFCRAGTSATGNEYNHIVDTAISPSDAGDRFPGFSWGWYGPTAQLYMFTSTIFIDFALYMTTGWQHVALVRKSGVVSCYRNGVRGTQSSAAQASKNITSNKMCVARVGNVTSGYNMKHKTAGLQFFKGTALYDAESFTPPTTETPLGYYASIG